MNATMPHRCESHAEATKQQDGEEGQRKVLLEQKRKESEEKEERQLHEERDNRRRRLRTAISPLPFYLDSLLAGTTTTSLNDSFYFPQLHVRKEAVVKTDSTYQRVCRLTSTEEGRK
ncbi:uncharacterized protein [Cardiocondyla obscurior]|uniref:uncharacterized protein n=1 Tax=Cardiocondyla obscurior TaxID=286306 RepID=UPI00396589E2